MPGQASSLQPQLVFALKVSGELQGPPKPNSVSEHDGIPNVLGAVSNNNNKSLNLGHMSSEMISEQFQMHNFLAMLVMLEVG